MSQRAANSMASFPRSQEIGIFHDHDVRNVLARSFLSIFIAYAHNALYIGSYESAL